MEHRCVDFRWQIRGRAHRLRRTHGDFHPYNILFREGADFTLLDASRGGRGDPADDLAALTINYVFGAVVYPHAWCRGLEPVWGAFWSTYLDESGDREVLEVIPPFFAWRALVVASPVWYPSLTPAMRDALLGFAEGALSAGFESGGDGGPAPGTRADDVAWRVLVKISPPNFTRPPDWASIPSHGRRRLRKRAGRALREPGGWCIRVFRIHPAPVAPRSWSRRGPGHAGAHRHRQPGGRPPRRHRAPSPRPAGLPIYVHPQEAVLSSQIEGTQSSLTDLLLHENSAAPGVPIDDVREVSNYVRAMDHGLKSSLRTRLPLSLRLIREIHGVLVSGTRGADKTPG